MVVCLYSNAARCPGVGRSPLVGRLTPGGGCEERGSRSWSGACGAEPAEAFGDLGGLPPGAVDAQAALAAGAGELGGGVQHPVAERDALAAGQRPRPAKQISLAQTRSAAASTASSQAQDARSSA